MLFFAALLLTSSAPLTWADDSFDLQKAQFYIESQYSPSLGLVRENEYIEKYWLWSDNELAAQALADYAPSISENITSSVLAYAQEYGLEFRSAYGAILGKDASFLTPANKSVTEKIWFTDFAGDGELQCADYADIAFLKSIHYLKAGDYRQSLECYHLGEKMFDGTGFKDRAYAADGDRYSTYKVALWKIADDLVTGGSGYGGDVEVIVTRILHKMQDSQTGGVYTHYTHEQIPDSQTNIETTSLAVLALTSSPSSHPNPMIGVREHARTATSYPMIKDMDGKILSFARAGQPITLFVIAINNHNYEVSFVAFVEVRDEAGATVYLQWQEGALSSGGEAEIGMPWIPERAGKYQFRTFLISDFKSAQVVTAVEAADAAILP